MPFRFVCAVPERSQSDGSHHTSVLSWWSESNPFLKGPTINLHAVAKPLMRWMYHCQALEFIRKNKGHALSTATVEIYMSYFLYVMKLRELVGRCDVVALGGTLSCGQQRLPFWRS
jgi:hypothetical protein